MCSSQQPLNGADSAPFYGPCVICGISLDESDQPTPVYTLDDSDVLKGWIHGATDCSARPESLPDKHPDYCGCRELGVASALTCPPVDLVETVAWLDGRIRSELRALGSIDGEYLQAYGQRGRLEKARIEGSLDGLVSTRDWLATGLERVRNMKGETR